MKISLAWPHLGYKYVIYVYVYVMYVFTCVSQVRVRASVSEEALPAKIPGVTVSSLVLDPDSMLSLKAKNRHMRACAALPGAGNARGALGAYRAWCSGSHMEMPTALSHHPRHLEDGRV